MFNWLITNLILAIPAWAWISLTAVGLFAYVAAGFLDRVPSINIQAEIVRLLGIIAMVIGVFMWGGSGVASIYKAQIEEQKEKVRIAEAKSQKVNIVIEEKIVEKVKYVKQKQLVVYQYIDREIVKYDTKFMPGGTCEIPKEFIKSLNDAALTGGNK